MRYIIENPETGDQENVKSLEGYDGWSIVFEAPDEIPEEDAELSDGKWTIPLSIIKKRKWEEIKQARDGARLSGFTTSTGHKVDVDLDSQRKIFNATVMAVVQGVDFSINWTLANNSKVTLNANQMKQLGLEVGRFENGLHATSQDLRAQIEAATTAEQVKAIRWP